VSGASEKNLTSEVVSTAQTIYATKVITVINPLFLGFILTSILVSIVSKSTQSRTDTGSAKILDACHTSAV
jgi:hypothetical protein